MKLKIAMLTGAFLLSHLSYGQTTNPSPYCAGGYDDGSTPWPHYISNVTLGSLNHTSGDTQYAAPHYVYYNNIAAPKLAAGNTYSLSVTHDWLSSHHLAVYIDYNQDNDFNDTGERVYQQSIQIAPITNPAVGSITIPANAKPGITRMRVMIFEDDGYYARDAMPCTAFASGSLDWGETEDYNVTIIPSTGITEVNKSNTDIFYPNPTNGVVYVSESLLGSEMTIYNIEGKAMQHGTISSKKIDVSNITPGQYIIKAISNNNVYTRQLTIVK